MARQTPYLITPAIKAAAAKQGVVVRLSTTTGKKLDAIDPKTGSKIRAFGALGYGDYHVFLRTKGWVYAEAKRKAYWSRHARDARNKYARDGRLSAGWLAAHILW